ncbi:MAG: SPFH domain-containing protein [Minisyncoccia bacterium]
MRSSEEGGFTLRHLVMIAVSIIVVLFAWFSWSFRDVPPGAVGVYYDTPYFFGTGGVRDETVPPGRIITWRSTDVYTVSTAPWTIKVHVDDMMSSNRVPLDFDVAITIQMSKPTSAAGLIRKFNGGPVTAFSRVAMPGVPDSLVISNPSGEFMSFLRDRVRENHMDEFIIAHNTKGGHSDANNEIEKAAVVYMNEFLTKKDVEVMVTNVALGRANPPDNVKAAMERTAEQVQMQTTEVERTTAQKARKAAEEASADADKAQQNKLGFSNAEYLKKLELETVLKVCGSSAKDLKDTSAVRTNCTLVYGQALPTIQMK